MHGRACIHRSGPTAAAVCSTTSPTFTMTVASDSRSPCSLLVFDDHPETQQLKMTDDGSHRFIASTTKRTLRRLELIALTSRLLSVSTSSWSFAWFLVNETL